MPCRYDDYGPTNNERDEHRKVEAIACMLMRLHLEQGAETAWNLAGHLKFAEAGVTPAEFLDWWERHQKQDLERKRQEAEQVANTQAKNAALAKLTNEEKKLLGL